MEKKLQINHLTISFRTTRGKVQAVRGVDLELYKGETLAIVGESGSGKSVTSRAILGILANNSIVESGEILYDGKDLLRISEDDFHKIRGDKIAMIFQDPLSSLNPIVRIGKQLTEAMLLNNRGARRESKKKLRENVKLLHKELDRSEPDAKKTNAEAIRKLMKFQYKHIALEDAYGAARQSAREAILEIEALTPELDKGLTGNLNARAANIRKLTMKAVNRFVLRSTQDAEKLLAPLDEAKARSDDRKALSALAVIKAALKDTLNFPEPNFFGLGYYLTFHGGEIPEMPVQELNLYTHQTLDEEFMLDFLTRAANALTDSRERSLNARREALPVLNDALPLFNTPGVSKRDAISAVKRMTKAVETTIDPFDSVKDSAVYTFSTSLSHAVDRHFAGVIKNPKEQKRFDQETRRHDAIERKGRDPGWSVVPADILDEETSLANIRRIITQIVEKFEAPAAPFDAEKAAVAFIDLLKETAARTVRRVTPSMAKARALKLMEEVGIPEPEKRYTQYPFQFSGGMRQRIVIAIALSADPDILICDEPTTALDVTIQSQILELINRIKAERQLSVIFITHDLGVVANMADRIAVMYAGKIVEYGTSEDVFYSPAHPYTWALLSSMPDLDTREKLEAIPGTPPNMVMPPKGDAFAARNRYAMAIDFERQPPMFRISDTHSAASWLLHPDAPKVDPPEIVTKRIERMLAREARNNG